MDPRIDELLHFWFEGDPSDHEKPLMKKWFAGGREQDRELARRFGSLAAAARAGELDEWRQSPRGRLALILLLDQVPRNLHRGSADAFATDEQALALSLEGIARGDLDELHPLERMFLLMPLQHAESADVQDRSVEHFERLASIETNEPVSAALRASADYAVKHRDIVARFGRFPHRNAPLERDSTEAEREFLSSGGPRFGQ